jgi:N-acetylneuraminate synthase/sialic acid synthase
MFSKYKANEDPYVIAEVGQNHQGDLDKAREFIRIFAFEGADAVKFQTRNNSVLFSDEAYNKKYESENAFAETYGAHREILELDLDWLPILKQDCIDHGVDFMSTPFDEPSLEVLTSLDVDVIKIASFDLGNLPFIKKIAQSKKPIVMSIGGGKIDQIRSSIDLILQHHDDIALLHCVSEYPCEYNRLGLINIKVLLEEFPSITIGSSDHFNGTLSGPVAYMLGARVFEKHVTLNRAWPGTDHSFALEPDGFRKFCRDIKRVRHMMPPKSDEDLGNEFVFQKLGKSLVAAIDINPGDEITIDMLSGKIFNDHHIPVRDSNKIIGKIANTEILSGQPIDIDHLN